MAEYLTNTTDLTSVANAIRDKGGTTELLTYPDEFVTAIHAIQTGIVPQLIVTVSAGAMVTATNGSKTITGTSDSTGVCTLAVPEIGTWSVSATLGGQTSNTKTVSITDTYMVSLSFFSATITVTVDSGASVSLQKDGTTIQTKTSTGTVVFTVTETGIYTIVATKNGQTTSGSVNVVSGTTSYSLTLTFFSATITVNVDSGASVTLKKGGTTIATKTSNGTAVFTVTETGAYTVIATKNGQTTSGSVDVVSGTTSYTVVLSFLKDNFADNDWASIIAACHSGSVPSTWVVGNSKTMTINGASYQIDIIGKNHDTYTAGGKAPLTFQMHYCYGETKNMNSSNTNSGGWKNSAMRTTHLPAILALMSTEVQNGIREVNKLTSAGRGSSIINTTADKLFLLSEVEIFGSTSYSAAGEGTQYDYYKAGNSKVKKQRGIEAIWWERSPFAFDSTTFCVVDRYGNASFGDAGGDYGVAFGFCF